MFEISDVLFFVKVRAWKDLICVIITFLVTLIFGVQGGILVAIIISLFMVVKHTSYPHVCTFHFTYKILTCHKAILKQVPNSTKFEEYSIFRDINLFEEKQPFYFTLKNNRSAFEGQSENLSGILMLRIEESLYFANVAQVKELFQKIEQTASSPLRAIILDASNIPEIDASAAQILLEMVSEWRERGIPFCIAKLRPTNHEILINSGLKTLVGMECIFSNKKEALEYVLDHLNLDDAGAKV